MWPLSGIDVAEACGVERASWPRSLASVSIAAVSLGDAAARADELFVALREDGYDGHTYVHEALESGAALALVSADWEARELLPADAMERCLVVPDTLAAFRRLAAFLRRRFTFPIVAVGGSNGKTTTKDMIAALLSIGTTNWYDQSKRLPRVTKTTETMNGWSGLPVTLTQRAHAREAPPDALVIEIGIDAVGVMAEHAALVDPDVVVLTTLGPEHIAGLGTLESVVREEMKLFEGNDRKRRVFNLEDAAIRAELSRARPGDILVCEAQAQAQAHAHAHAQRSDGAAGIARGGLSFVAYEIDSSIPTSTEVEITWHPDGADEPAWRRRFHVPMAGRHNGANFAVAVAAAIALGRSPEQLTTGFETFVAPSMRCEIIALPNGAIVVDDAYNASPPSMAAAFELLASPAWKERPKLVILGDMLDLGAASEAYHLELCDPLATSAA
jgi:UDP-N-acetylmuramoyl-tripeptide--D-alanyl-D-alanine ligase